MNSSILPEDPELTDTDAPHRRRKTFQDWVTTTGGILAILASLGCAVAWLGGFMPWLRIDVYAQDKAAADLRVLKVEATAQSLTAGMAVIQRNGLLTLQLQLQQKIDGLTATLKTVSPSNPNYYQVNSTIADLQQQVDEIKRQLRK